MGAVKKDGITWKSFMVWIPPDLHRAVREKLYQDRISGQALSIWFLKKYVGWKDGEKPSEDKKGTQGNAPGA